MRASIFLICFVVVFTSCANSQFSGAGKVGSGGNKGSGSNGKSGGGQAVAANNEMLLDLDFKSGDKQVKLKVKLQRKKGTEGEYVAIPGAVSQSVVGDVPVDVAKIFLASKISARLAKSAENQNETNVEVLVSIDQFAAWQQSFVKTDLRLNAASIEKTWEKNEGSLVSYEKFGGITNSLQPDCKIASSGNQIVPNTYAVVLTMPAPCDFRLPTVTVTGFNALDPRLKGPRATIPIGTYWWGQFGDGITFNRSAHNFPLSLGVNLKNLVIDNGFMLLQPDGNAYLLVDGGLAAPSYPYYKSAATIANDLSNGIFGRASNLLRPNPQTVFKRGSVIAIYDDSPDMAGEIEVSALVDSAIGAGLTLNWKAQLR